MACNPAAASAAGALQNGGSRRKGGAPSSQLSRVILLLALAAITPAQAFDYEWKDGRSTWYGGETDYWTIHDGHCWHSYLADNIKTGWDVAAMTDTFPTVSQGMCGRCFEIQCRDASFKDNYGQYLDRNNYCYDSEASVVVQITDQCECQYDPNAYSNKRWCCGDMPHFDLSKWAFEKLAPTEQGVIGIKYREVDCTHTPYKKAYLPAGKYPSPGTAPPDGFDPWRDDPRPWPQ